MTGRRKTRLTAEGFYYLTIMGFLVVGAVLRDINLLMGLFAVMFAALIWHGQHVVASLKRLRLRRVLPRTVAAGDTLTVDIVATNGRKRGTSWGVVVADTLQCQSADAAHMAHVVFARLAAEEETTQTYQGMLPRRGKYLLGPLVATTRFPLGLVRRTVVIEEEASLLVVPRQGQLTPLWRAWERQRVQVSGQSARRRGAQDGEFHSLRPYRPGDSPRLIHWRTSARQGELMVRQFEQPRTHGLAVFLDLSPPPCDTPALGPDSASSGETADTPDEPTMTIAQQNVELAVSFAATILADRCRHAGSRMLLGVAGAEGVRFVEGPASQGLLLDFLTMLAVAEPSAEDQRGPLLQAGLPRVPADADAVLIHVGAGQVAQGGRDLATPPVARSALIVDRLLVVDASSVEIFDYLQPSQPPSFP